MANYYKWLNEDGTTPQQRHAWKLPRNGKPGDWMPGITGDLVACENGYHIVSESQLIDWIASVLWECEPRGEVVNAGNKSVCRQARLVRRVEAWNDRTARLFACDCAERALSLFGAAVDPRSVDAIRVARLFAVGQATQEQLSAAQAAAWDAARDAARAASVAAWDASVAAWDAARAAAQAAEWYSAWDAARYYATSYAEREWQNARLLHYILGPHNG